MIERKTTESDAGALAENIGLTVTTLLGEGDWQGENPYTIKTIDPLEGNAYILEIRRGVWGEDSQEWITVSQQEIHNPSLVRTFNLNKIEGQWIYDDSYLAKYGEPSTDKLKIVHDRLLRSTSSPIEAGTKS